MSKRCIVYKWKPHTGWKAIKTHFGNLTNDKNFSNVKNLIKSETLEMFSKRKNENRINYETLQ